MITTINEWKQINESTSNNDLVIVDIQPEYENNFTFGINDFTEFINNNYNNYNSITFLYNGEDTLGMISELDYIFYLLQNGLNEDILDYINFYDKGYGFFRVCIDEGYEDELVNIVKYMYDNNINDSRELEELYDTLKDEYDNDLLDLIINQDSIGIPDLMDELITLNNIILTGGAEHECLKEVEVALDALGKKYSKLEDFIF